MILSGPSGVGKDTVIDAWHARDPRVVRVVGCTTRAPREGEVDGVNYTFLSRENFNRRIEQDRFLEYKLVFENYYGTPADQVEEFISQGKIAILKIDVQGAMAVLEKRPDTLSVFIAPPDMFELERRLRDRSTDSPEAIEKRLAGARAEMETAKHYQHILVNDDVEKVVSELERLVNA